MYIERPQTYSTSFHKKLIKTREFNKARIQFHFVTATVFAILYIHTTTTQIFFML